MRLLGRTAKTAAGVLGMVLLAGCAVTGNAARQPLSPANPTSASTSAAAQSPVPAGVLRLQVPSPIAAYELTPTQAAQEKYVIERATQVCMRGFGFVYDSGLSEDAITRSVQIDQEFQSRMYGVSDPAAVHTYGYHLPAWTQGAAADLVSALPPAELSVLDGSATSYDGRTVPQGGCRTLAANQLAQLGINTSAGQPDESTAESEAVQIQTDSFEQAQSDPRVLAVFGKWSACMRTYGDDYQTPFVAAGDPRWATGAPTAQEIETAEQDIDCKTRVNLIGTDSAVVADYQNTAISRNTAVLAMAKAQVAEQGTSLLRAMAQFGS